MALTGELSDLSLSELIELFCNQRKTGRLKVVYPIGPGYFYLHAGSVVHARIGVLRGIDAVYCALTLPNASFTFSPAFEAPEHSINQPWTSVVLEGLRRMDEGVTPPNPFPEENGSCAEEIKTAEPAVEVIDREAIVIDDGRETRKTIDFPVSAPEEMPAFLAQAGSESRGKRKPWTLSAAVVAVALVLAVIGVPWGMHARSKAAKLAAETRTIQAPTAEISTPAVPANTNSAAPAASEPAVLAPAASEEAELLAKRQRDARAKDRTKFQESATAALAGNAQPEAKDTPGAANSSSAKPQPSTLAGRKVSVQVTYDENGRVTQASGGDATALRIARQKRFPAGKAGSATVTIPIN